MCTVVSVVWLYYNSNRRCQVELWSPKDFSYGFILLPGGWVSRTYLYRLQETSHHLIMIPVPQCESSFIHHIIAATATSSSKSDPHACVEIACLSIGLMALHTTTTAYQMQTPYQIPHVAEPVTIVLADQAPLNAEGDQCICGIPPNASIHVKAVSLSSSRRITNNSNPLLSTKLFLVIGTVLRRAISKLFNIWVFLLYVQ